MMKIFLAFALLCSGSTAFSSSIIKIDGPANCLKQLGNRKNMISIPDMQEVAIVQKKEKWYQIRHQDQLCWTHQKNIRFSRNGMTWGVIKNPTIPPGLVLVGCEGIPIVSNAKDARCDPYEGETPCSQELPVLCINHAKANEPPANLPELSIPNWGEGEVKLLPKIKGNKLGSLKNANRLCSKAFGSSWKMAEFHGGRGWRFIAKGTLSDQERFWVTINDQSANCWDTPKSYNP